MPSDRDSFRPKTPPQHIRAQTAPGSSGIPDRPFGERESRSAAIEDPIARLEYRQKRASIQIGEMGSRLGSLEVGHASIIGKVDSIALQADRLITDADAERKTRDDRAETARLDLRAAEERKERADAAKLALDVEERKAERAARGANRKLIASIVVPTIAALLSGIAVILAATRGAPPTAAPAPYVAPMGQQ